MQQEIKLTNESSNTVFVDDVDVRNGVYAKSKDHDHTLHLEIVNGSARMKNINGSIYNEADSLSSLIYYVTNLDFYTIPDNKRIVTRREVTIDDLKNTDHVGFCSPYLKFFIQAITSEEYCAFNSDESNTYSGIEKSVKVCIKQVLLHSNEKYKIYRFTTRKELYQWLAE